MYYNWYESWTILHKKNFYNVGNGNVFEINMQILMEFLMHVTFLGKNGTLTSS